MGLHIAFAVLIQVLAGADNVSLDIEWEGAVGRHQSATHFGTAALESTLVVSLQISM